MLTIRDYRALVAEERELRPQSQEAADKIREQINLLDVAIEALDAEERRLIRMRYIYGWRWQKIELKMNYSHSEIFRKHRKAMEKLGRFS